MAVMSALWSSLVDDLADDFVGGLHGFHLDFENRDCREPIGCTAKQFAAATLLRSIPKKFQGEIDQKSADAEAFKLFRAMNDRCQNWQPAVGELGPYDELIIGEFRKALWDFFNPEGYFLLKWSGILKGADFGPGVAPGARDSSFLDKIGHSVLTAPNQLTISLFDEWVRAKPERLDCEIARVLSCGSPEVVEAVKLTPVPKTSKISRLVKPEPLLGMFFQKGIQRLLEGRLLHFFGIDLSTQPGLNAELAKIGSLKGTYATIDLKSASDCIALKMCERFIPAQAMNWLKAFRSEKCTVEGEVVSLNMIATMGNAFCFPLQTAIFACAVAAVYRSLGIPLVKRGSEIRFQRDPDTGEVIKITGSMTYPNWGVFGDDIVVCDDAYESVIRFLRYLGFLPNEDKSFNRHSGNFRESCGSDWFNGVNVRGVYVKTLNTMQDWYILINNLTDWSARHDLSLKKTIAFCLQFVQRVEVPPWENPDAGIRLPLSCVTSNGVFRASNSPKDMSRPHYQGSYLYKRWVPRSSDYDVSDEMHATENCYWNSSAIFQAAIKGVLRGGRVSVRIWETRYLKRVGVAPCWDYIPPGNERSSYWRTWMRYARAYFGAM